MGSVIQARCTNCFFRQKDIYVFQGSAGPNPHLLPAIDLTTNEFVIRNFNDKDYLTGKVVFYNDPKMYRQHELHPNWLARLRRILHVVLTRSQRKDIEPFITWGYGLNQVSLSRLNNKCPKCHKFSMRFDEVGDWD